MYKAQQPHPKRGKVLHDARRILLLLLGWVGVVEADDHLSPVVLRVVLVQQARLDVSNVQVPRWLWREPRHHLLQKVP